jgi:hypothetical protein
MPLRAHWRGGVGTGSRRRAPRGQAVIAAAGDHRILRAEPTPRLSVAPTGHRSRRPSTSGSQPRFHTQIITGTVCTISADGANDTSSTHRIGIGGTKLLRVEAPAPSRWPMPAGRRCRVMRVHSTAGAGSRPAHVGGPGLRAALAFDRRRRRGQRGGGRVPAHRQGGRRLLAPTRQRAVLRVPRRRGAGPRPLLRKQLRELLALGIASEVVAEVGGDARSKFRLLH